MNSTPSPTEPRLSVWRVLWLGTLIILALELIGIFASAYLGGLAAFFILLVSTFVISGVAIRYIKDWAGIAGAIGFLVAIIIAMGGSALPLSQKLTGEQTDLEAPIAAAQAPQHNVALFEFNSTTVKTKLTGYHVYTGQTLSPRTGGRGYPFTAEYVVAPLVDANWTPADEVSVWVVCNDSWETNADVSDNDTCQREWTKPHNAGLTLDMSQSSYINMAIEEAITKHNLRSHPNAKYVLWSKDAVITARGTRGLGSALILMAHVGYAIAVFVKQRLATSTSH